MSRKNIIVAEKLSKQFPHHNTSEQTIALDKINFILKQGGLTAIIGPDGAGKTTFLRLIAGLMLPTDGTLTVFDTPTQNHEQEIQNKISYMPQKFGLYEDLTVKENMRLYADLHGISAAMRNKQFSRLLNMTGLTDFTARLAGKLSGGMKQKLGLACTLISSPQLLLLDEPTAGVDPLSRRELWEIIQHLVRKENLSVIVNTAYINEAALCDDVYIMHYGHILASGAPHDLCKIADNCCFQTIDNPKMPSRILQSILLDDKEHIIDAVPYGNTVHFILKKTIPKDYLRQQFNLLYKPVPAQLEDAFMILLNENKFDPAYKYTGKKLSLQKDYSLSDKIEIEVKDLVRKFGNFTAVDKISFTVKQGEIFGLLGPNGAGKTTTFRMLCGLLPMTSGYLSVAGVNLRTARVQARSNIGYVAQKFSLYGNLTVEENLSFFGGIYGLSGTKLKNRINDIIREFHLEGKAATTAAALPGGYKQRLSMAAALLHAPQILFLDEPTSGIDPLARRIFWRQITNLAAQGTTIIITTHFMEEAEYCDRILIQDQGKLLALGTPRNIRKENGSAMQTMNDIFITIVEKARQKSANKAGDH